MKRRTFIQYSALSFALTGCGFEYSPYRVETEKLNYNADAISTIQSTSTVYPFSIALLSDTHRYYSELKKVISKIESDSKAYKFVIHGGDITDAGLQTEFDFYNKQRNTSSLPFVHGIGNHDALTNGIFIFRNTYGTYNFSFQVGQVHFIFFNNNTWEFGDNPVNLDLLELELSKAYNITSTEGGQIIVVNHINHDSSERYSAEEIERYRTLMSSYNVTMSINGHNHEHTVSTHDSIEYLTIGSVSALNFIKLTFTGPGQFNYTMEQIDV